MIDTFKNFFRWVWKECRDWRTFVLLVVVCIVLGSPVWVGYLLTLLFGWKWSFIMASAVFAFWWIPGMPYFAICVSVTLALKKIGEAISGKRRKNKKATITEANADKEASGDSSAEV